MGSANRMKASRWWMTDDDELPPNVLTESALLNEADEVAYPSKNTNLVRGGGHKKDDLDSEFRDLKDDEEIQKNVKNPKNRISTS